MTTHLFIDYKKKTVILITGSLSGMGKTIAMKLIEEGHAVYGASRRVNKMKDLKKAGRHIIALDITKDEQIEAGVNLVIEKKGELMRS